MNKILMIGNHLSEAIINPLARMIKSADPSVEICAAGLYDGSGVSYSDGKATGELDHCYSRTLSTKPNGAGSGRSGFVSRGLRKLGNASGLVWRWNQLANYDVVHLQGFFSGENTFLFSVKKSKSPVVVSCWGSDLLREDRISVLAQQKRLLNRADVITVASPELKEMLLAKFGQSVRDKVRETQFSPNLESIWNEDSKEASERFRSTFGLRGDKKLVCIGHNGTRECQHIELISSLERMPSDFKNQIHLVVPMTYGAAAAYVSEVTDLVEKAGFSHTILTEFMSEKEVASLRHAIDLLVYAPVSDAYSATVSQFLGARTVCILGSWLPYSTRRRAGFKYWDIDTTDDAANVMTQLLSKWASVKSSVAQNRDVSKEFFDLKRLGQQWLEVYKTAIAKRGKK